MERRAHERIDTSLPVKCIFDEILYSGTIDNLSEQGMFISTGNFLPCGDSLEVIIPLEDEISKFHANIKRIEKIDDFNYSMGIEIHDAPDNYKQFVCNLRMPART